MSIAATVAAAQREIERTMLTDTCRIRPNVAGVVGSSGQPQTWPSVSAIVRCQIQTQRPTVPGGEVIDDAILPKTRTATLPANTAVQAPYHIEWVEGGITLEMVGQPLEQGTHGIVTVVNCVEVAP